MDEYELIARQREMCAWFGAVDAPLEPWNIVGVSESVGKEIRLNRLRPVEGNASSWFSWGGEEWSDAADFFAPIHGEHLLDRCPEAFPYLALPPGWRFPIAPNYGDVWFDESLLAST
jgi:hypothetical protein